MCITQGQRHKLLRTTFIHAKRLVWAEAICPHIPAACSRLALQQR